MNTNHATERVTAAIQNHLITVDAVPPTREATRLAGEVTELVWSELGNAGLNSETLENLFVAANSKRPARRAKHELRVGS